MADSERTALTAPAAGDVNQDDEARMLLGFLQYQRDSVLKIVEGLPEDAWQAPVVSSGWTVAGMLAHLGGVEHHWLQHVTTGVMEEPPAGEEAGDAEDAEDDTYDPEAPSPATGTAPASSPTTATSAGDPTRSSPSPPCPGPRRARLSP